MQELNMTEIESVGGAGTLGKISNVLAGASVVAGGLALVPTPASPSLAVFVVVSGVLAATFGYMDSWGGGGETGAAKMTDR